MSILKTQIDNLVFNTFSNDWSGVSIHQSKSWEPHISEFLKRNLDSDSVFVDVGSNYGWHTINSSKLCNSVHSFEPQRYMFDIQKQNIEENNISNIFQHNCGLGDKNETKQMSPIDYNCSSINMGDLSVGNGGEKIEVKTLDYFQLPKVDFIKIDVQGYEKYVIKGGVNTIINSKPIIIIELEDHQLKRFNYGVVELFELLRSLNYHIYFLDYHYPSDHVCVHQDNLVTFIQNNLSFIKSHTETNNLNYNIQNGVTEKIISNEN